MTEPNPNPPTGEELTEAATERILRQAQVVGLSALTNITAHWQAHSQARIADALEQANEIAALGHIAAHCVPALKEKALHRLIALVKEGDQQ